MVRLSYENSIEDLLVTIGNFGKADLDKTVEILKRYRIPTNDFAEYVEEFMEDTGMNLVNRGEPLDLCYLAYDQALQLARQHIERYTGLDIMNDSDYTVYGDYFCSMIDCTENGKERLIEAVCEADEESRDALLDNHIVRMFFDDVEVLEDVEECG